MRLTKIFSVIVIGLFVITLFNCSGTRYISAKNPESEASVRLNMTDGTYHEGIIITGDSTHLVYVDAETHEKTTLKLKDIESIERISKYFDFEGNPIPINEIKANKNLKNTLLYGGAGLALGAAVGTGVGIGLYAANQPLLANASILVFGGLGAYYFGKKGVRKDYDDAAFKARQKRYQEYKELRAEKRRLEELRKKKAELLKKLQEKKRKEKEKRQNVR